MKAKDLIKQLQELDPETEIHCNKFDDYKISNDIEITTVYRSDGDNEYPVCFVSEQDETFQVPMTLIQVK